ncbi:3-deoxy-manno-octulosonate cytidylyltransferase [Pontibacter sp. BT310]|uniref:3-deoxy-manno-octulosonate cytidylyltransferase n=1 Tax=Pontibacter populi TaxID=890055 RepID=A0ABS6XCR8_9BACT|nr:MULTISPECIES: 3-deoxy-manno-octulosonate cytidylyltransferase [Pontibacter]MBJ6118935.1 3-deoxy-manno-octulosonate cytidylyltransferase [Pontibacter sp. BT310]MBR0571363.1 3-deoxy-manno-octulosonate cytidylyltransferase [Microvirga sp. STS03]MBW3365789.1 3-deoxy-manno-octulosonate cytidylyltransferase [Pontibacter populi]
MDVLGIIPARFASTRFPGKPLTDINGKTMIRRVYEQASASGLSEVIVATDDERIFAHVLDFGGKAVMTAEHHQSGTDRCFEAYKLHDNPYEYIINIQGDEPFIKPEQIDLVASCFNRPNTQLATLVKKITTEEELFNTNAPKVVLSNNGDALYFSRQAIPYCRNVPQDIWHKQHSYYKHIGIYGYRADILEQITQLPPSALELAESLEQLRWLENGYKITTALTEFETIGIDSPEDLEKVRGLFS